MALKCFSSIPRPSWAFFMSLPFQGSGPPSAAEKKAFVVEVLYAGVFTLHNVPEEQLKEACLIECPRLLFPFARRIVADATRDGGFPPLLLEPIDFVALYMQSGGADAGAPADGGGDNSGGNGNA